MPTATSLVRLLGVSAVAVAAIAAVPVRSSGASAFCAQQASYPGTTITWTGKATGAKQHDWSDANNWSPKTVPGKGSRKYQTQYACIGGGAKVDVAAGDSYGLAGIDIGENAQVVVANGGGLALGAASSADLVPSYVERSADLELDASTLGGNGTVAVAGTLDWTGQLKAKHKLVATQTGSGKTVIAKSGKLLVDGGAFGGAVLGDSRSIDNSGTLVLSKNGYLVMGDGTSLTDESGSSLELTGVGGIYPATTAATATLDQLGTVTRDGNANSVIGVQTVFGRKVKPVVTKGAVAFAAGAVPTAKLQRGATYGIGSCVGSLTGICHSPLATRAAPQGATARTSTAGPKTSKITISLVKATKLKGAKALGRSIAVIAPDKKTSHSTSLTFNIDKSLAGFKKGSHSVFRGKKKITICAVHGLTAKNTSCLLKTETIGGNARIIVITIQPKAIWTVAR